MFINFAMYSGGCIYVKISVFLVKNNGERERERERERAQLVLTYMCTFAGMCEFWYV